MTETFEEKVERFNQQLADFEKALAGFRSKADKPTAAMVESIKRSGTPEQSIESIINTIDQLHRDIDREFITHPSSEVLPQHQALALALTGCADLLVSYAIRLSQSCGSAQASSASGGR